MDNNKKLSLFKKSSSDSNGFSDVTSNINLNLFEIYRLNSKKAFDLMRRSQGSCNCKDGCCPSNNPEAAFGDYLKNVLNASNNSSDTDTIIVA